jgi:hypothetical protein
MGASKRNPTSLSTTGPARFSPDFISRCEHYGCQHFAAAMSRITRWPLHAVEQAPGANAMRVEKDKTIIVHRFVAMDDIGTAFDVTGIRPVMPFISGIVERLNLPPQLTGVTMSSEEEFRTERFVLPAAWDEAEIEFCRQEILRNQAYLNLVTPRPDPALNGHDITLYAHGGCVTYAAALARFLDLPAVTMRPTRLLSDAWGGAEPFHALVLHPDGQGEDAWGKAPLSRIGARYNMAEWRTDAAEVWRLMVEAQEEIGQDTIEQDMAKATAVIERHRVPASSAAPAPA